MSRLPPYRMRVSVSTMGVLILIFLFLLSLSFIAGFYLGEKQILPENPKLSGKREEISQKTISTKEELQKKPLKTELAEKSMQEKKPQIKLQKKVKPNKVNVSMQTKPRKNFNLKGYFSLQVAALTKRQSAEKLAISLRRKGYNVVIKWEKNFYKIRVGKYPTYEKAKTMRKKLFPVLKSLRVKLKSEKGIIIKKII